MFWQITVRISIMIYVLGLFNVCHALELWSDEEGRYADLGITGKVTSLFSDTSSQSGLLTESSEQTALARLRLGLNIYHSDTMNSEFAYEQRAQWVSDSDGLSSGGLLPSISWAPYRLTQLDWEISSDEDSLYRHEIDRGYVAFYPEWGQLAVGRQAIGLGRGVLFGAVDIFSPFSPLEVDREWRRGIDAVRAEYRLSSTNSAEIITAFGESWEQSALISRLRGYLGNTDGSFVIGKRAEDFMTAMTISTIVKDAEVHGEFAVFNTHEKQIEGGLWGNDTLVAKTVLGTSYTFDIGNGLTLLVEHHYNGFGIKEPRDIITRLTDEDYQRRYLRGDMQTLGRNAFAAQASYLFNDSTSGSLMVLTNPKDDSGVVSPSMQFDINENTTLIGSAYIPWGDEAAHGIMKSEYGSTPISLYLQLNMYY